MRARVAKRLADREARGIKPLPPLRGVYYRRYRVMVFIAPGDPVLAPLGPPGTFYPLYTNRIMPYAARLALGCPAHWLASVVPEDECAAAS